MDTDKIYTNPYLDKHTKTLLNCLEDKGEISEHTSKELQSHISLINYGYITSSLITTKGKDSFNELLMLIIGVLASTLMSGLASSLFTEITKFNSVIAVLLVLFILIRVIRR